MTPDQWPAVERLYLAALERDTGERAAFLHSACAGDEALRREVESLLEYEPKAKAFLEPVGSNSERPSGSVAPAVAAAQGSLTLGRFAGRRFGSYEVQALIAAGGMGEVYRAIDTQLHRAVAIKVLLEHLSDSPERRDRFRREALLISSLNHPHICALYHVGTHEDCDYLVMEHIDGETLQDRVKRGRMSWSGALEHLIEIADALDTAHGQGIVHRDLKPANVMLTRGGAKVLDFGLAARRAPRDGSVLDPALAGSRELTVEGRIMGTVPYMSPEQLQGKPTDPRTDIFAFGALAYEMLTGRPAFTAESQADLIGAILKDQPKPIATEAPDVPSVLTRTIDRCLAKDPRERWQTAADLLFQLRSIVETAGLPVRGSQPNRWLHRKERMLWMAAVAASLLLGAYQWRSRTARDVPPAPVAGAVRFPLLPPAGMTFPSSSDVPFALSPDGRRIAYVAFGEDGTRRLWLRTLASDQQLQLAGTEGASSPFWSPDSEWVAFFATGSLKKVRVTSPIAQVIASTIWTTGGAAWSRKDVIVFPGPGGLYRVSANGGPVTRIKSDGRFHLWPQFLDDGERYVYSSFTPRSLMLGSLADEAPRTLMTFPVNVSGLAYVSKSILFVQDGVLFARPFDERRGEFTGAAQRILDGIPVSGPGRAPFSVSAGGVLAFWTEAVGTPAVLRWFTRSGEASPPLDASAKYFGFAVSPDMRQIALSRVGSNGGPDLWVRSVDDGAETQLTFDGAAYTPRWSPDGSQILFTGIAEQPPPRLFIKNPTGPGAARALDAGPGPQFASSWSGHHLLSVVVGMGKPAGNELMVQRVEGGRPEPLALDTVANESEGSLSTNGKWIAYTTDQTGRDEVWVASFPSGTLRRQLSRAGGVSPRWCDGESAVVYLASDKRLTLVSFRGSAERIDLGGPQPLFVVDDVVQFDRTLAPTANYYATTADCRQFLVATKAPDLDVVPINIVVNWPALLER